MKSMMQILREIDGLAVAPVSPNTDKQNRILISELPFKVYKFRSESEHNGWVVPHNWFVKKALIKKNGKVIYNGKSHPLSVVGYSKTFNGFVPLEELKKHLFYNKNAPNNIVYHCDFYYKPFKRTWGFSVPYNFYKKMKKGKYEIILETEDSIGQMKVLVYTHKGASSDTIIINAHNCHAAQLNDGPSGYVVGIEFMKRIRKLKTRYSYKLIIAPEHLGTVFYLASLSSKDIKSFKYCVFLEMLGNNNPVIALQESFNGDSEIDMAAHHYLKNSKHNYWSDKYRKIVGNDENVWESPGIEVPTISLSRCKKGSCYPQYHLDSDNINIISKEKLEESVDVLSGILNILENNFRMKRKFKGLVALSNPKYDFYFRVEDPSIDSKVSKEGLQWNYLMNRLPRYFDENHSVLQIAEEFNLKFDDVYNYVNKFREKGLIDFV